MGRDLGETLRDADAARWRLGGRPRAAEAVGGGGAQRHAFMGAFELGSRLPPPPGAATTSAGQLRFSLEQMLEVLEAALLQPRHGLASEGQLLRWQLRRMLDFGQPRDAQAAPPLACPPPSPSAPLDEPRVRVVVPFVASERARLASLLRRWAGSAPCALPRRVGAPGVAPGAVDLTFLFADPRAQGRSGCIRRRRSLARPRAASGVWSCGMRT